ncbi:hypothetical protein T484DRAFT_2860867 [Baffinella frigidus]|nr:hypothetical protein T484DRAFT_2860867 [Cryptophyta sp. CCMP2293]
MLRVEERRAGRRAGRAAQLISVCFVAAAISVIPASKWWSEQGRATEMEDSAWVNAIPAFGSAMSADDLNRQIHWLHKHNAANPDVHVHKLDITLPNGEALQPQNRAALDSLQVLLKSAYSKQAGTTDRKVLRISARMRRALRSQVALIAKSMMIKISKTSDPTISPAMMRTLEKGMGLGPAAHMCRELALPCPITSGGNAAMGDVLAGFSTAPMGREGA